MKHQITTIVVECCDLISPSHKECRFDLCHPPLYTQAAVVNYCDSGFFRAQRHEARFPTESNKFFHNPAIQINRLFHATIVSTFGSHLQNFDSSFESDAGPTVGGFAHQRFRTNQLDNQSIPKACSL